MVRPCLVVLSLFGVLVWMPEDVHVGAQNMDTGQTTTAAVTSGTECIRSCLTSTGRILPDGSYPFCDDCGVLSSCSGGFLTTQKCPLGTNYYDRVSKVCVTDPSVCIKDNPSSGTPPIVTQVTASTNPSQPVTASSSDRPVGSTFDVTDSTTRTNTVGSTAVPTTNTVSITPETAVPITNTVATTTETAVPITNTFATTTETVVPITNTVSTTTETAVPTTNSVATTTETAALTTNTVLSTTGVVKTSTSSSSAKTSALSSPSTEPPPQISLTPPVSSSSLSTTGAPLLGSTTKTTPTSASTNSPSVSSTLVPGYTPESGAESESFLFALDRYNLFSQSRMRAGALGVSIFNRQPLDSGNQREVSGTWYRFFGVTMVPSRCRNTAENMGANSTQCPLDPAAMSGVQLATCDFKVHFSPGATGERLALTFMMCF